ncbi:hypothetical protein C2G38_2089803, partial [Gigaspora rosea]
ITIIYVHKSCNVFVQKYINHKHGSSRINSRIKKKTSTHSRDKNNEKQFFRMHRSSNFWHR